MRFLFSSHDGLGLGHARRNLAIASGLTALEPRASVLLAVGADYVSRHGLPPRVNILMPGLCKLTNAHYSARHLCIPVEVGARGGSTSRQSETLQNFFCCIGRMRLRQEFHPASATSESEEQS